MLNSEQIESLVAEAVHAMKHAYVPYSQFQVGSALLTASGEIIRGCNVENATYGATNCAERTALFTAIAAGHPSHSFLALAIVGDTPEPITPCGICRQVMAELCEPTMPVILANIDGKRSGTTVSELLPGAFKLNK